jgi:hypothetical protein
MPSRGKSFYLFHSIETRRFSLGQFPILGRSYAVGTPRHFDNAPPPHLPIISEVTPDLEIMSQNTAFCQKDGIQSEKTHKF